LSFLEIVSNVKQLIVRKGILINIQVSPPNQSLKLTEPAVDDFAARKKLFKGKAMPAARIFYMELAARCRSLAPVR